MFEFFLVENLDLEQNSFIRTLVGTVSILWNLSPETFEFVGSPGRSKFDLACFEYVGGPLNCLVLLYTRLVGGGVETIQNEEHQGGQRVERLCETIRCC